MSFILPAIRFWFSFLSFRVIISILLTCKTLTASYSSPSYILPLSHLLSLRHTYPPPKPHTFLIYFSSVLIPPSHSMKHWVPLLSFDFLYFSIFLRLPNSEGPFLRRPQARVFQPSFLFFLYKKKASRLARQLFPNCSPEEGGSYWIQFHSEEAGLHGFQLPITIIVLYAKHILLTS